MFTPIIKVIVVVVEGIKLWLCLILILFVLGSYVLPVVISYPILTSYMLITSCFHVVCSAAVKYVRNMKDSAGI